MQTEEFLELEALEFDTDAVMSEVILLTSLMIRSPDAFIMTLSASAEYKSIERQKRNLWLTLLLPNLLHGKRALFYTEFLPQNFLLPDVCVQCLTSFTLTTSGRLRTNCPFCPEVQQRTGSVEGVRDYFALQAELAVFWIPTQLQELLLCQLLYKYYSPQGDRSWHLQLPQLNQV